MNTTSAPASAGDPSHVASGEHEESDSPVIRSLSRIPRPNLYILPLKKMKAMKNDVLASSCLHFSILSCLQNNRGRRTIDEAVALLTAWSLTFGVLPLVEESGISKSALLTMSETFRSLFPSTRQDKKRIRRIGPQESNARKTPKPSQERGIRVIQRLLGAYITDDFSQIFGIPFNDVNDVQNNMDYGRWLVRCTKECAVKCEFTYEIPSTCILAFVLFLMEVFVCKEVKGVRDKEQLSKPKFLHTFMAETCIQSLREQANGVTVAISSVQNPPVIKKDSTSTSAMHLCIQGKGAVAIPNLLCYLLDCKETRGNTISSLWVSIVTNLLSGTSRSALSQMDTDLEVQARHVARSEGSCSRPVLLGLYGDGEVMRSLCLESMDAMSIGIALRSSQARSQVRLSDRGSLLQESAVTDAMEQLQQTSMFTQVMQNLRQLEPEPDQVDDCVGLDARLPTAIVLFIRECIALLDTLVEEFDALPSQYTFQRFKEESFKLLLLGLASHDLQGFLTEHYETYVTDELMESVDLSTGLRKDRVRNHPARRQRKISATDRRRKEFRSDGR